MSVLRNGLKLVK